MRQGLGSEIQKANHATSRRIESLEVDMLDAVNAASDADQEEHRKTQQQIAELKQGLPDLSDQLAQRIQDLKIVLEAFQATRNKKILQTPTESHASLGVDDCHMPVPTRWNMINQTNAGRKTAATASWTASKDYSYRDVGEYHDTDAVQRSAIEAPAC
ncbi:hypothetical protein BJY04DRAFT_221703 [Aspergillus karnatakaensis]|uniref:uncharacterized protein n=1 Tax=Aspergillus karnatakaensis TaxID=1810916 RepID=UPI003CCD1A02